VPPRTFFERILVPAAEAFVPSLVQSGRAAVEEALWETLLRRRH
jgi:hypothetical protein